MTDAAGARVAEHEYFPFGQEVTPLGEGDVMKFTGHERDLGNPASPADDLDYMHARHFSALTGRFLSVDPASGDERSPQSWNRYAYVLGSPMKFVDPTGEYGRGANWTDVQWKRFDKAQQQAANRMEKKVEKLKEQASKLERKGKSKEAEDLREQASHLAAGARALRGDVAGGYIANAVDNAAWLDSRGSPGGAARVQNFSRVVEVNIEHKVWTSSGSMAQQAIGHESLHTAGLRDQYGPNGAKAYKYGLPDQRKAYDELKDTPLALINPDHLMDLIY